MKQDLSTNESNRYFLRIIITPKIYETSVKLDLFQKDKAYWKWPYE